jgi:hypothetical protein
VSDFDSPWKEALELYFRAFLAFFFPQAHAEIDWSRGYEILDKELQQVAPGGEQGRRVVDKLVKVWRPGGEEAWVLIHIEVQSQQEEDFPLRMYVYNYRIERQEKKPNLRCPCCCKALSQFSRSPDRQAVQHCYAKCYVVRN